MLATCSKLAWRSPTATCRFRLRPSGATGSNGFEMSASALAAAARTRGCTYSFLPDRRVRAETDHETDGLKRGIRRGYVGFADGLRLAQSRSTRERARRYRLRPPRSSINAIPPRSGEG